MEADGRIDTVAILVKDTGATGQDTGVTDRDTGVTDQDTGVTDQDRCAIQLSLGSQPRKIEVE